LVMKYGREVAAVELHALHHVELGLQRLGLLDGDHALVAHLLHGLRQHAADFRVAVGRDGAHLGDLVVGGHLLGVLPEVRHNGFHCHVDAALEVHGVHAGGHRLGAFLDDRLGENGRRGGAVARMVVLLRGHFAHHLGAHVLELVGSSISLATVTPSLVMRGAPKTSRSPRCGPWGRG
jgi:hypothetical protein